MSSLQSNSQWVSEFVSDRIDDMIGSDKDFPLEISKTLVTFMRHGNVVIFGKRVILKNHRAFAAS